MAHKQFRYGDLNPATHPQDGRTLDPEEFSGLGSLSEAARRVNSPKFLDKLGFPLKGIILRTESKTIGADEGWGAWSINPGEDEAQLWRCRVRIPEIHGHLPIPETFGQEGLNSVMALYPVFQAKDHDTPPPVVGEICYVDFGDRKRFEDPIYLGMVKSGGTPVEGGASSNSEGQSPSAAANNNNGPLNGAAPPGDSPGSGEELDPNGQSPVETPPIPDPNDIECKDTKNPTANRPPSCGPYIDNGPGMYETAVRGRSTGKKQMDEWNNRQRRNVLVLAASKHTLQLMEAAFIEETGITEVDLKRFIQSGYRNVALQACARAKYDACVKEWKRKGGRFPNRRSGDEGNLTEEQPSPVARPGWSKHNSGVATDFDADGTARSRKSRTTALWVWLQSRARDFGWVNPAWARNNPAEPWHFEFDEALARSKGLFPRDGQSQNVPARQS